MGDNVVVRAEHLSKKFCRSLKRSMLYGISDIARNAVGMSSHSERLRKGEFWAVDDFSFELGKGECLGFVGPNGSGKTTILKMINGIFWPDKGKIAVRGRVGALIAVGAGFHPMLTGRENIYLNGAIMGMSKKEIEKKFDSIVDFAAIGDFLDSPVKFYSSGMYVRLGFAVAVHCDPDILIVDEVLAVGDFRFQRKCLAFIRELIRSGTSIILVSHNPYLLGGVCSRSLLLREGKISCIDETKKVIETYEKEEKEREFAEGDRHRKGDLGPDELLPIRVLQRRILDSAGGERSLFQSGESLSVRLLLHAERRIDRPLLVITLTRSDRVIVCQYNNRFDRFDIPFIEGEVSVELTLPPLDLADDFYTVEFSLYNWESPHFFGSEIEDVAGYCHVVAGHFRVEGSSLKPLYGVFKGRSGRWRVAVGKNEMRNDDGGSAV